MNHEIPAAVNFLLVDDREANLTALQRLLERDGLNLLKARSGSEALELLLQHDVALALIDVQMPGMDGFELAELMRGSDRTRRIPIVFITAGSTDQQRRFEGYEKGAVDFLQKPIESDVLKSKATVFFDLYSERQEVIRRRDEMEKINRENARLLEESRQFAAALQQADQRKDEFLATLAHELRNPLSPILSGIQLLSMTATGEDDGDENAEMLEMIERQVHHMVRLVDDLLEVSRITSGRIHLQTDSVDVADIVQHAIETSQPNLEAGGHRLSTHLPTRPLIIDGDMTRLAQVVSNLLNNAARYTADNGEISLSVDADESNAVISVKDNGIGIPAPMQHRVFELFSQVDRQLKQSEGGLGIGLALVKRIVELHDGTVSVASDGENQGAEFKVTLPRIVKPSELETAHPRKEPASRQPLKIMAVDDNLDALRSLQRLLVAMGHEVAIAESGSAAMELFQSFVPSVAFLDIGMPEMDGYEVAERIRRLPGGDIVKLFALTGWGQEQDRARSDVAGFDFHLVKPVTKSAIEDLLSAVAHSPDLA
ncbi:ATP-binding response regulator [Allorhodopirellula solitaria]|uniref:histidine kinase n=1 Tax=Allorhodopirellula solitaria TaxID=2527987 RepID=A0A5C5XT97_9BACT|nr:response regulator [Allorhodopirellula solitaria]TWT66477.1 Sensor histidine kinase TmoS [Allorhodopirellula solitaria]